MFRLEDNLIQVTSRVSNLITTWEILVLIIFLGDGDEVGRFAGQL